MRTLILCEVFPLVHGTRALQMAKVAGALSDRVAASGGRDAVFVFSGVGKEEWLVAQAWQTESPDIRAFLPYVAPARANRLSPDLRAPTPNSSPEDRGVESPIGGLTSEDEGKGLGIGSSRLLSRVAGQIGRVSAKLTRNAPFVNLAIRQSRKIIADFSPDVVMTVSNPMLWHRVGLQIKREFPDLPWAAFFSDPRPLGLLPKPFRHRNPSNIYKARLSRQILQSADAVIGPNRYMLEWMESRLSVDLGRRRFVVPHCGQVASTPPPVGPEDLRGWILHVGSLWKGQVTADLLQAIKNTAEKYPEQFKGVMCVGHVVPAVQKMVRALEMEPYVKLVDRVSPSEACSLIAAADANLLADTPLDVGYFLHSKFADYAVNGRPVLVVGPATCPMRDYLESYGGGFAVGHRQADIERALREIFVSASATAGSATAGIAADQIPTHPPRRTNTTDLANPFLPTSIAKEYFRVFEQIAGSASHDEQVGPPASRPAMRRGA